MALEEPTIGNRHPGAGVVSFGDMQRERLFHLPTIDHLFADVEHELLTYASAGEPKPLSDSLVVLDGKDEDALRASKRAWSSIGLVGSMHDALARRPANTVDHSAHGDGALDLRGRVGHVRHLQRTRRAPR